MPRQGLTKRPLLEPKRNPGTAHPPHPPGREPLQLSQVVLKATVGCSPAQRLRPHAENTRVQVSNGHSKLDGSVAGTAEAELPNLHFLDPKITGQTPIPLSSKFYHCMIVRATVNYKLTQSSK